jgi:hypothetical protein
MKNAIGITLAFAGIAMFVWNGVPRLMSDMWHARDFVPAQSYKITHYECTNWNLFMFNDCTVTFASLQSGESRQITDWRFGPAPSDPVQLLQRRDDVSAVTTDVSLRTLWNRVLLALLLVGLGAVLAIRLVAGMFKVEDADAFKVEDAWVDAPRSEPAPQPVGRTTFGKRRV